VFDAEVVDGERRGKDGLVGVPSELVAVVAAGSDLEAADPRATERAEHRDRGTGRKSLTGAEIHVDLLGGWLEVALRGGAGERDRHGGLDVDVAEIAEACRF
jgi:hypothetical protein